MLLLRSGQFPIPTFHVALFASYNQLLAETTFSNLVSYHSSAISQNYNYGRSIAASQSHRQRHLRQNGYNYGVVP